MNHQITKSIEQSLDRDIAEIEKERKDPKYWKRNEQFFSQMEIRIKEDDCNAVYNQSNEPV